MWRDPPRTNFSRKTAALTINQTGKHAAARDSLFLSSSTAINEVENARRRYEQRKCGQCDPPRREPARLAISASDRNAALTAAELGNSSATSGSMTTTLERTCNRSMYFPRTSVSKSERLYCVRGFSTAGFLSFLTIAQIRPSVFAKITAASSTREDEKI
jgi:hypothetical protein